MKTLVAFYSRTGTTKKVAQMIASTISADIEEIVDLKNRKGVFGFIIGGYDALKKNKTRIKSPEKNPEDYDFLVVGTPVWGSHLTPAIRTYLNLNKFSKKVAFFCTCSGSGIQQTLAEMKKITSAECVSEFGLTREDIKIGYEKELENFTSRIK